MAQGNVVGIITQVMNVESGVSQQGKAWSRQTIIVKQIGSKFDSFVALDLSGDKINEIHPQVGMIGDFQFDVTSREGSKPDPTSGNTRWFTSLSCYRVKPIQMAAPSPEPQTHQQQAPAQNYQQQGQYQLQPQMDPQQGGWNPQGGQQGGAPW